MLIGICGSICAGKHTTAEYLVQQHGFLRLHLPTPTQLQSAQNDANDHSPNAARSSTSSQSGRSTAKFGNRDHLRLLPSVTDQVGTRGLSFPDVDSLLEFVTKRWREHWVLTDIFDEATLDLLLRRPFFLLINVDAPVGLRFQRFSERYVISFLFVDLHAGSFDCSSSALLWIFGPSHQFHGARSHKPGYIRHQRWVTQYTIQFHRLSPRSLFSETGVCIAWDGRKSMTKCG